MLLVRDWMRAHPEDRDLYAAAKRDLAARTWKYVQNYADAKSDVIEVILSRARAAVAMKDVETRGFQPRADRRKRLRRYDVAS